MGVQLMEGVWYLESKALNQAYPVAVKQAV